MSAFGDLACAIDEASVTVTIIRFMATSVIKGRVSEATTETRFDIEVSIQPTGSKDLQLLPEGMRNQDTVKIFTETELFSVRRSESKTPDRILYRGVIYQVELVDDWHELGNYFRVIAVRTNR
jgi:hypothetical protein